MKAAQSSRHAARPPSTGGREWRALSLVSTLGAVMPFGGCDDVGGLPISSSSRSGSSIVVVVAMPSLLQTTRICVVDCFGKIS